ncbi:unnamed protein product, partial [Rotaria magnacalcarata]
DDDDDDDDNNNNNDDDARSHLLPKDKFLIVLQA